GVIHQLYAELGEVESLGIDLGKFMERVQKGPVEFLTLEPLMRFLSDGDELKPGQLLSAFPPFVMKESSNGVSFKAIEMFDRIRFLADFARQIRSVPDDGKVKIKVINVPSDET